MSIELKQIVDPGVITDESQVFPVFKGAEKIIEVFQSFPAFNQTRNTVNFRTAGANTYIGRDAKIYYDLIVPFQFTIVGGAAAGALFAGIAPVAFPWHSLVSTYDVIINGKPMRSCAVSSLLPQLVRLLHENRMSYLQAVPSNPEVFLDYKGTVIAPVAAGAPGGNAFDSMGSGMGDYGMNVPDYYSGNGSYADVYWCTPSGKRIVPTAVPAVPQLVAMGSDDATGPFISYNENLEPTNATAAAVGGAVAVPAANTVVTLYMRFTGAEPLLCSPFDTHFNRHVHPKSIYGIDTFDLTANMDSGAYSRLIRFAPVVGTVATGPARPDNVPWYPCSVNASSVKQGVSPLQLSFLTKKPNLMLGMTVSRCLVPHYYYVDQVTSMTTTIAGGQTVKVLSGSLTIPLFPERQMIFVCPNKDKYPDATIASFMFSISNVSITWGTQTNEMQSFQSQRLYETTVRNGYAIDFNIWRGQTRANGGIVGTVGSPVVVRPSIDYYLGKNEYAPGVSAYETYNIEVTVTNNSQYTFGSSDWSMHIVSFNSDFLEFEGGDVREIVTVIKPADVLLPLTDAMSIDTVQSLLRGGGGASQLSSQLSSAFDKMKGIYNRGRDFRTALAGKGEGAGRMTAGSESAGMSAARRILSRHA